MDEPNLTTLADLNAKVKTAHADNQAAYNDAKTIVLGVKSL